MTRFSGHLKAAVWMVGAITCFTLLAVAGRAVSVDLSTFEIMLYRSMIGLGIVLTVSAIAGTTGQIRMNRMGLHTVRNLSHFAGQNLWFYAITVLPLAQVFALEFTTPIWGLLLAPFFLGERLTRKGAIAAVLGFAGILIVARPMAATISPGLIAAALCAVGFALSPLMTKRLTRTETITCIMFWLNLMQLTFAFVIAVSDGRITPPPVATSHWMILIGVAGLGAHFCLTRALQSAPANVVMPMDFVRLPVIAVVAVILYHEPRDPLVFVGAALIFVGNWINLRQPTTQPQVIAKM